MKICVIGTGYVGLVAGTCFAETGNDVISLDFDEMKIAGLKSEKLPIYEPGLQELIRRNVQEERLCFTTDLPWAVRNFLLVSFAVGTPPGDGGLWERPGCSPPPRLFPHKLETLLASLSPRQAQQTRASTDSVFWDDVPVWNGEEPRLFILHPIAVCLFFTLFALILATLTLSQPQGRLCLFYSLSSPRKTCLYPLFAPRSTSLRKANSYILYLYIPAARLRRILCPSDRSLPGPGGSRE